MGPSTVGDLTDSGRFATVLLVDDRGWLLLQERDENAPRAANLWGMVGGHVEAGEDFEAAAYRELEEETGVRLPAGSLRLWRNEEFAYPDGFGGRWAVYVARVGLSDADIVLGEGRQIVFVEPGRIAGLPLAGSSVHFVLPFPDSAIYRALRDEPPVTPVSVRPAD